MTNKISKEFLFTELSIKIATLEMKIDKVLELLTKPDFRFEAPEEIVNVPEGFTVEGAVELVKEHMHKSLSDNEKFLEEFK